MDLLVAQVVVVMGQELMATLLLDQPTLAVAVEVVMEWVI